MGGGGGMNILKIPNQIIKEPLQPLTLASIDAIALHHMAHATADVKTVESWHIAQGWRAIGYNYWVGLNGDVYEGRGLCLGAGVENQNGHIISIGCQGDYDKSPFTMPKAQHDAVMELCRWLIQRVPTIRRIDGHKAWNATACPGRYFPLHRFTIDQVRATDTTDAAGDVSVIHAKDYTAVVLNPMMLHCSIIDSATKPYANYVNAGYFGVQLDGATYPAGILVDDGKVLSNVATHGTAMGTLLLYDDGRSLIMPVDDVVVQNQCNDLRMAVSGMSILPYQQMDEGFVGTYADVARTAARSMIGLISDKNLAVIVCHKAISAQNGGRLMRQLGCDAAITLDGGGSTCMRVGGVDYITSARRINSVVWW